MSTPASDNFSAARILIVDDNPTNLKLARYVLESAGYVVTEAVDADHAQELLKQMTPDLILMDIALPGMDGLTLTRKLKADERLRNVPVVALTASAMMGDDKRALLAGCAGYITKPFDVHEFPQQVAVFLQGDKADDPTAGIDR
jgi:CheY-like chemotaxis protein